MLSCTRFRSLKMISISLLLVSTAFSSYGQDSSVQDDLNISSPSLHLQNETIYFADIEIRGRPIFQVGSLGSLPAGERAGIINRRLASLIENSDSIPAITINISADRNWATIQAKNRVLLTVTQLDAADFNLSIEELAHHWSGQLERALNKPPLFIDVTQLLSITIRDLVRETVRSLPSLIGTAVVILITWVFAGVVRRGFFAWAQRTEGDRSSEILITRLGFGGV